MCNLQWMRLRHLPTLSWQRENGRQRMTTLLEQLTSINNHIIYVQEVLIVNRERMAADTNHYLTATLKATITRQEAEIERLEQAYTALVMGVRS
jgi:gluconate kinase